MKKRMKKVWSVCLTFVLILGFILSSGNSVQAATGTLVSIYGTTYSHIGNCVTLRQLQDPNTLSIIKKIITV